MNTLQDVVGLDHVAFVRSALPEPMIDFAADIVDAFHAVEIGDYMATAVLDITGISIRVAVTAADEELVEFTCSCGAAHGAVPCVHTASFYFLLVDYFDARVQQMYAQPGQTVAPDPYRLHHDSAESHPTVDGIINLDPEQLRRFIHTLQILDGETVNHMESALAVVQGDSDAIKGRAHDLITRTSRKYILEDDPFAVVGMFTELGVRLDQLMTLSDGEDLFEPYKRFWNLLIGHRRDFEEEIPLPALEGLDDLIKTVHTHVLTALAKTPVDSRELVEWLIYEQQEWEETPLRLRDIGHRLSEDDIQYYFENSADKPEWKADVELFTGDPRTVIERSLDQGNVADAVGALMAIRTREEVLEEANRILEVVSASRTLGMQVEAIVDLIGFINGLEEGENQGDHVDSLLFFNAAFPDPQWVVAAMELKQDIEPLLEWYNRYHSSPFKKTPGSVQVKEGMARASWAIALDRAELMNWIVDEGILFTKKGEDIMDPLGEMDPDLFTTVYKQWFEREQIFLQGSEYVDAAAKVLERVAEYNMFGLGDVIHMIQVLAMGKHNSEQLLEDLRVRIEDILL